MLALALEEITNFAHYFGKYLLGYSLSRLFLTLPSHKVNFTRPGPLHVFFCCFFPTVPVIPVTILGLHCFDY